jgi:hypothetical protein
MMGAPERLTVNPQKQTLTVAYANMPLRLLGTREPVENLVNVPDPEHS